MATFSTLLLFALAPHCRALALGPALRAPASPARRHGACGMRVKEGQSYAEQMMPGLPPGIADRLSFQTGGQKKAGQEKEILILWKAFKACYPNADAAAEALSKNTAVILPSFNSPTKIKGTYSLLVSRFGKAEATEIITKNPGVLVCSPAGLKTETDESIRGAANLVETLDKNKGVIKAVAGAFWFALVGCIAYGIATKGATPPGMDMI